MGTGTLFHLLRWVTVGGKSQESGGSLGAGSIILINMRSESHIWHLQWGEAQQVWQYIPDSWGCLSPDFSPNSFTLTHSFLHIHRCSPTRKPRVSFINWAWNWRAWLAGNSQKSHHGHYDPALAWKTMTMTRPILIWMRKYTHKVINFNFSIFQPFPTETLSCRYTIPLVLNGCFWSFHEDDHLLPHCPSYQMVPESILRYSLFTL